MSLRNNRIAAVAVGAAVLVGFSSVGAVAAGYIGSDGIRDNSIRSVDIRDGQVQKADVAAGAVGGSEIANAAIGERELSARVVDKLNTVGERGPEGPQGPQGVPGNPASDVLGGLEAADASSATDRVVIKDLGGSILDTADGQGHTPVTSITLEPGTYLVSAYGHFDRENDNSTDYIAPTTDTYGALATWVGDTWTSFDQGRGTYITGAISPKGFVEATAAGAQIVTVTETTELNVSAFGYNEDRGGFGSASDSTPAQFTVLATVSAVKVG
ncbi:MAG: hypothetical protein ACRDPJ_07965 [Nocardioidaceae bacterium]